MKIRDFGSPFEDIKNLKSEVDCLKNTVKSLMDIKQEGKKMKNIIDNIKTEIKQIQTENVKTYQRIHNLEEEFHEETDEEYEDKEIESIQLEGLFSCTQCPSQFGIKEHFVNHLKSHEESEGGEFKLKCDKCEFVCQREITLSKHINTKHAEENSETEYDYMREDNDFFQVEIVENEAVYACNMCDEGFDTMDEIKKHISDMHKEIISDILMNIRKKIIHMKMQKLKLYVMRRFV